MTVQIASERTRKDKMSQEDLAAILDVSSGTIVNWEKGYTEIPGSKLVRMADLFGCSCEYLMGLSEERLGSIRRGE